ncbi:PilW family protein [uncultured Oxalicibacterium sp.]|uniref:PilW family protein n=1 Tax=uncultured Oxalicibacterium sp. TaxID=1168540 RepID=UPI0025E17CD6|nr:PilW family protein [uncultured Oxalicibacterium sp.]
MSIRSPSHRVPYQYGLTLVELMVAMTLNLFVLLTLTGLLLSGKASYNAQDQQAQMQETGRYVMEVIARQVRQAGHEDWNPYLQPRRATASASPHVLGLDARTLKKNTPELESITAGVVNGSDVLALRFFAPDAALHGVALNCAGFIESRPEASSDADEERSWSIFFVARDSAGEAELRCKYRTKNGWSSDAIARGVESFQVLYGVELPSASGELQYMNATAVTALDAGREETQMHTAASYWHRVRAVRFALLVGGTHKAQEKPPQQHHLFGESYSASHARSDSGVLIEEEALPAAMRQRVRMVFTQTIHLRNGFGDTA